MLRQARQTRRSFRSQQKRRKPYFSAPPPSASATTLHAQQDAAAFDNMLDAQPQEYGRMQKELREAAL
jgi:hypothetical protein